MLDMRLMHRTNSTEQRQSDDLLGIILLRRSCRDHAHMDVQQRGECWQHDGCAERRPCDAHRLRGRGHRGSGREAMVRAAGPTEEGSEAVQASIIIPPRCCFALLGRPKTKAADTWL